MARPRRNTTANKVAAKVEEAKKVVEETVVPKVEEAKKAVEKAVAPKVEEAKKVVEETVAPKVEEVKKAVEKTVTPKVEEAKKTVEETAAETVTEVKKAVKTAARAAKQEISAKLVLQYEGKETDVESIKEKAKNDFVASGHKASEITDIAIYLKTEDYAAYYVINGVYAGKVDLF